MSKKRSISITIISRIEMVGGFLGTLVGLIMFIAGIFGNGPLGYALGVCWGVPALIILITGELTFRLRPSGRIMHLILLNFVVFLIAIHFIQSPFDISPMLIIIFILVIFFIFFFSSSSIKRQFENKS